MRLSLRTPATHRTVMRMNRNPPTTAMTATLCLCLNLNLNLVTPPTPTFKSS